MSPQVEAQREHPGRRSPERSKIVGPSESPSQPTRHGGHSHENPPNFQVLLVEDNLINRRDLAHAFQHIRTDHKLEKVLSKQLQKAGCTVHVANHGQEALEFLQRSNVWRNNPGGEVIDVVLMDLEMPVMDGLTCARRIRELQGQSTLIRHVPLIAVTANARMEQVETSMAAGMVRCSPFSVY